MSDSGAQTGVASAASLAPQASGYQLSDDLARLCLPQEFKDSYRALAWTNSVCFLFLLIGLIGLRPPRVVDKPLSAVMDVVPAIYTPPEQEARPPEEKPPDEEPPPDTTTEAIAVPTVVAAASPESVAFPVQVPGVVRIAATATAATPPPPKPPSASGPSLFNRVNDGGNYPAPSYPVIAQRNRYQGTVLIDFKVNEAGVVTEAKIEKTSGFAVLDEAALEVVRKRWRFPAGSPRWFQWPCVFKME